MASWVNEIMKTTAYNIVEKAIADAFQELLLGRPPREWSNVLLVTRGKYYYKSAYKRRQ